MRDKHTEKEEKRLLSALISEQDYSFLLERAAKMQIKTGRNTTLTDAIKAVIRDHPDYPKQGK